jgi:hypothetical protein
LIYFLVGKEIKNVAKHTAACFVKFSVLASGTDYSRKFIALDVKNLA